MLNVKRYVIFTDSSSVHTSAFSISFSSQFPDIDHPTTIREYRSRMTERYSHPCIVGISAFRTLSNRGKIGMF